MKLRSLALLSFCVLLAACSKINQQNYSKLSTGMTKAEVEQLLHHADKFVGLAVTLIMLDGRLPKAPVLAVAMASDQVELTAWLGQPIDDILEKARAGADDEKPVTAFINVHGSPALVAAAAITPGTDPTVMTDGRPPSVLIFIDILNTAKLAVIGNDFGVEQLHIATPD